MKGDIGLKLKNTTNKLNDANYDNFCDELREVTLKYGYELENIAPWNIFETQLITLWIMSKLNKL